jgi:phage tail sheath protein FI
MTASMSGGVDGHSSSSSDEITAYSYFKDPAKINISLLISGEASNTLATYLINEIAETRKDCVVFISPEESDVVNKEGSEITNIVARRNTLPSTSYAVMDGNYKYIFDRYNSVYRWIPFNADVAGICAQADNVNPYVSPAGFARGNIKGAEFLAFVPNRGERDDLYINGINPIASFPGKGKILFGDKTMLARPSSFDRINVRRLFIILEKAIANAAENLLFEFNDDFTRLNFVSMIEPFLRDIQSQRGIEDFKVICDSTNNTPVVINRNEFRGDIFIKPTKSINFIGLNFVAVASGVEFSEVVNAI